MKNALVILVIALLPSHEVLAQEGAGAVSALCSQISSPHLAGANYIAGVDVGGFHVVDVDLNQSINKALEVIVIPVEIDLISLFNLSVSADIELTPSVAEVKIFQNGRVEYNGRDISAKARDVCAELDNTPQSPKVNGHKGEDTIGSGEIIEGQYP